MNASAEMMNEAAELAEKLVALARSETRYTLLIQLALRLAAKCEAHRYCEENPILAAGFRERLAHIEELVSESVLITDPSSVDGRILPMPIRKDSGEPS